MAANGYGVSVLFGFGSLQLWVPLPFCRRQPVSPMTMILVGLALGSGSDWPATTALVAPEGSGYSHELTGNSAGLFGSVFTERSARLVVAAARRFICTGVAPLIVMLGQGFVPPSGAVAAVIARAIATLPVRPLLPLG